MLLLDLNVMTYEIKPLIKYEKKEKCVKSVFFSIWWFNNINENPKKDLTLISGKKNLIVQIM
jgi:hypothetical protein